MVLPSSRLLGALIDEVSGIEVVSEVSEVRERDSSTLIGAEDAVTWAWWQLAKRAAKAKRKIVLFVFIGCFLANTLTLLRESCKEV